MAARRPTKIGCKVATPALAAITPVTAGKMAPPACAITNMRANQSQLAKFILSVLSLETYPNLKPVTPVE